MSQRYFVIAPQPYETTRLALDAQRNVPSGETTYEPLATAPRTQDGRALLAVRAEHCQLPEIAAAIAAMLASGDGTEISEAEYVAFLPPAQVMP